MAIAAQACQPVQVDVSQQGRLPCTTLVVFVRLSLAAGVLYPVMMTGVDKALFPTQAGGSIIERYGKAVGSSLIGQNSDTPGYFWGRISVMVPNLYNAQTSNSSNLGPNNSALTEAAKTWITTLKETNPTNTAPIPADLTTVSASGLDPEISSTVVAHQVERVIKARHTSPDLVKKAVAENTKGSVLGVFDGPVVNVLELDLALDDLRQGF